MLMRNGAFLLETLEEVFQDLVLFRYLIAYLRSPVMGNRRSLVHDCSHLDDLFFDEKGQEIRQQRQARVERIDALFPLPAHEQVSM